MTTVELAPEDFSAIDVCPDLATGIWYAGTLEGFRTDDGGAWLGHVRWTGGVPAQSRVGWYRLTQLRGHEASPPAL